MIRRNRLPASIALAVSIALLFCLAHPSAADGPAAFVEPIEQSRPLTATGEVIGPDTFLIGFERSSQDYVLFHAGERRFQTLSMRDIILPEIKNAAGEVVPRSQVYPRPVAMLPGEDRFILRAVVQNTKYNETREQYTDPATGAQIIRRVRRQVGTEQVVYFFEWHKNSGEIRATHRLADAVSINKDGDQNLYERRSYWSLLRSDADGSMILLHYDSYNTHSYRELPDATYKMALHRLRPGFQMKEIATIEAPIKVRVIGRRHIALLEYTEENRPMPGYVVDTEDGSTFEIEVPPVPDAHLIDEDRGMMIIGSKKFGGLRLYSLDQEREIEKVASPAFASVWAMGDQIGLTTGHVRTSFTYEVRTWPGLERIRSGPVAQMVPSFPAGQVDGYTVCQPGHALCLMTNRDATKLYLYSATDRDEGQPNIRTRPRL